MIFLIFCLCSYAQTSFLIHKKPGIPPNVDAEESLKREGKLNKYKHVMTINKNFAIGVMRDELIGLVATGSDGERRILFEKVTKEIQTELIPVRKGRSFNRHKNAKSKRFFNNIKRNS